MTLANDYTGAELYDGNDSTTEFAVPWKFNANSEIVVTYINSVDAETTLTEGTHYSIAGAGTTSGIVTYPLAGDPLATDDRLAIERILPLDQTNDATSRGSSFYAALELTFDKILMKIQQLMGFFNRCIKVSVGYEGELPSAEAIEDAAEVLANGGVFGTVSVMLRAIHPDDVTYVGDGIGWARMPSAVDGMQLVGIYAHVYTVSSSGLPTFQIHNLTEAVDMLTTKVTIDVNEKDSLTATTAAVIDILNNTVSEGDEIRADCDIAGTGVKGAEFELVFRSPTA